MFAFLIVRSLGRLMRQRRQLIRVENPMWEQVKRRMGRVLILVVSLSGLWLLLSGYFDHPLLLFFGVVSVAFTVWLALRAGVMDDEGVPTSIMPGIFGYWFWLAAEIGKSNIDVAQRALAIKPALSPKLFYVHVEPRSNAAIATFANSITLTPGTVSIDISKRGILVHSLTNELCDEEGHRALGHRVAQLQRDPAT